MLFRSLTERLHCPGVLQDEALQEVYGIMDVFAFSSKSETQGMVVTEAMADGLPVIALDAPGVREVVEDGVNGRLLPSENIRAFAGALSWFAVLNPRERAVLAQSARRTAERFSMERCAAKALDLYGRLIVRSNREIQIEESRWATALGWIRGEWEVVKNLASATTKAVETAAASAPDSDSNEVQSVR